MSNRKLNITLILAADKKDPLIKKDPFMPLSLPILASVAPEHNYTLIDMLWEANKVNLDTTDEIIGISFRQSAENAAFELADEFIKRGKTVILGGAQPSVVPHKSKSHATTVVIGEAEQLWPKLLNDYINNALLDFYVCSPTPFDAKGKSFFQLEKLPDLKNLPIPNRSLLKRKYTFDITFASRGCPINCDFCLVSDIYGKKIRFKDVDEVIKDISTFKGFYYLLDDTVFGRPNCYDYYIELYSKLKKFKKTKYWTGQANIDAANHDKGKEVIKTAARSGLVYAAIGLESINKETLEECGAYAKMGIKDKNEYLLKMKEQITFIQSQGIFISGWFAIGYESDNLQTYYDTLQFCLDTHILPVFTPVRALNGSRLYKKISKEANFQDINKHISNIKHPNMDDNDVIKALKETAQKGFSRKANRNRIKYYFNVFRKSEKNLNDAIYRTIFAMVTQKRMRNIIFGEIKRLEERIGENI